MKLLISILLTFSLTASANCPYHVQINSGESAPCDGYFMNSEANEIIKKDLRDYELTLEQLRLSDLQISTIEEDRDKWRKEAMSQAEVRASQSNDMRNGFLYGIGITLAIIFGASQVSK